MTLSIIKSAYMLQGHQTTIQFEGKSLLLFNFIILCYYVVVFFFTLITILHIYYCSFKVQCTIYPGGNIVPNMRLYQTS